jgi:hypothetical protein
MDAHIKNPVQEFSHNLFSGVRAHRLEFSTVSTVCPTTQPRHFPSITPHSIPGIGLAFSAGMFRVTEFCNRKPRSFGAAYLAIAVLLYVLAFAVTRSSSYKAHQNDFQSGLWFVPLGLTFLSAGWGVMAILYILLGSKLNQLNSWMRTGFAVEPSGKPIGRIGTCLRIAVTFIFAILYAVIIFPLTFILIRALLHSHLS